MYPSEKLVQKKEDISEISRNFVEIFTETNNNYDERKLGPSFFIQLMADKL
jgi:hypothetical protein